ncbi:Prs ADP-ribosylating toxin (plasmid) [Rhodovastum atsumiense]|uniref:RES family NAD+ phosphorylase n=1 Tax=Rhodovastum atsumiense TaxID=504468 RepID=UPI002024E971|nr:RES family NAD+ phosphorylase [Rhodovastum atsumiense]CAH2605956.1 Prs ADP-ribosylating toxin [Rhodovastum atsumiense]
MTRTVWRIATDAPGYEADDLTGAGAKTTGGRWNEAGLPVVYASESPALASLETIVHLNADDLPLNRYLVAVTIPDDVWAAAQRESLTSLPVSWDAEPARRASMTFASPWLRAGNTALLLVPSAIAPEETNILINPRLAASAGIGARKLRKWLYAPRLAART